jgi:hypothetical protein
VVYHATLASIAVVVTLASAVVAVHQGSDSALSIAMATLARTR